jgi:type I restriction enzyme S subunit
MTNKWLSVSLGEVVTLQRGFDLPSQKRRTGKVPIVSSSGISDYHSEAGVKGPGVVTGRYGTIGKVFFIKEDYWPLNTTLWVKDFHGNDPKFSAYLLRTIDFNSCSDKSGVPGVNRNDLHRIPVLLPPLLEQRSIAHVLGTLDDLIELNRQTNEILEEMARALFKSWFVDFDPVRAKLEGRALAGMDVTTAALFPDHFQDSELGQIPKGWEQKRWGDIATLEYGKSLRDYRENGGKYRVFGTNGPIGNHSEALCKEAGIVIGRKGAYRGIHYSPEPFFVIDTAFYLKPEKLIDIRWAYYELLCFDLNNMDSGSAIPSTSRDDFYKIPVALPPLEIQLVFGEIVGSWFAITYANNAESRDLATLRDTLLPKLLSGEVKAPAVDL